MAKNPLDVMLDAHSDLHLASVVRGVAEGSYFRTPAGKRFASALAKLADKHAGQQYRDYERARSKVTPSAGGTDGA